MKRASILFAALLAGGNAHAADAPSAVLVVGVGSTEATARDPRYPSSVADYVHNFGNVLTLTERAADARGDPSAGEYVTDFGLAIVEDFSGRLLPRSRRAFDPLRGAPRDLVIAHSWGAMNTMYAIRDGLIPAPKRLVIVNPPLLTPDGTREWRKFAERFPQLAMDVYIGTDDFLHWIRKEDMTRKAERYSPGDALTPFLVPTAPAQVRVRMYPGDHSLLGFLEFASRRGEYGLTTKDIGTRVITGPPIPEFLRKDLYPGAPTGYRYLFEVGPGLARAQALARSAGIGRTPQTRELLQARAEERSRDRSRSRWEYVALLVHVACDSPYVLREHESRGLVPGIAVPLGDVRLGYERDRRSMSRCENELVEEIIAGRGDFSIRGLADRGERYRREHNPVRIAREKTKKFFSSVGRAFAEPFEKLGEAVSKFGASLGSASGSGSGGSQREPREPRESPTREFSSPTFDQLRTGNFRWD